MDAVAREEELLGLLAGFPDGEPGSDRELSFSDLLAGAGARASGAADDHAQALREEHPRIKMSPEEEEAATAKRQWEQATARERRQRRRQWSGRGSCGGGGDGVLLNFYVPGLLTRSMTAPRPGRGAAQAAPAKAAAVAAGGKARTQAPLGIGWWPALWGRGRDRRRTTAKARS